MPPRLHPSSQDRASQLGQRPCPAQYHRSKAKLLEMKIARQGQETMSVADHNTLIDAAIGVVLTELSALPGDDWGHGSGVAAQVRGCGVHRADQDCRRGEPPRASDLDPARPAWGLRTRAIRGRLECHCKRTPTHPHQRRVYVEIAVGWAGVDWARLMFADVRWVLLSLP